MSDIQDYIDYIIKKHEKLTTISAILVYINRIHSRLVFKIKINISYNYKCLKQTNYWVAQVLK